MLRIIKKYNDYFKLEDAKSLKKKIISLYMLILPHILACLILILFFPEKVIGILIVGLIFPDFSYFLNTLIRSSILNYPDYSIVDQHRKTIAHIITFIVIIFLFFYEEYVLFLAGEIHLFLDWLGF